ncbi:MAG TPA: sulfurtransferase TusA family protein [Bacillota bacterium]|jgi:tRNA 2-thiouridine synthesizing protein A
MDQDNREVPQLDLRGEFCPYTFIHTMLALEDIPSGGYLSVLLDDGQPVRDVPRSLKGAGHLVVRITPEGPCFRLLVLKDGAQSGEAPAEPPPHAGHGGCCGGNTCG